MEAIINQISYCIRKYLKKEGDEVSFPTSFEEWEKLFTCSVEQNISGIIYDTIRKTNEFNGLPVEWKNRWKNIVMYNVTTQMRTDEAFGDIYDELIKADIIPLVVKGAVCRSLYENPEFRISGDEDILLRQEDYEKAHNILSERGFLFEEDAYKAGIEGKEAEITYQSPNKDIIIELHLNLFDKGNEVYSAFNAWFEDVFDDIASVNYKNRKLYTLSPTSHFLYLCCHAFKHFVHSGFGIRPVMDIIAMADIYGSEIDWMLIWKRLKEMKSDMLFLNIFYIGQKYFGVPMEKMGGNELVFSDGRDKASINEEELIYDLLAAGVHGRSSIDRVQSSLMTLDAVKNQEVNVNKSKIKALLPNAKDLSGRYKFLKKFPFLLPVAWVMRIFTYLKNHDISDGSVLKENISSQIGEERIRLLEKYNVIQK